MNRSFYLLIFMLLTGGPMLEAKSIIVHPGKDKPITTAIRLASPGDSIMVSAGNYTEGNIIINKSVFLIGINKPVLDGEGKYEIMTITSDFVIVEGFHFYHSGSSSYDDIAALRIMQSGHILVRNNFFQHAFFGIYCQHAYSSTIYNNRFHPQLPVK